MPSFFTKAALVASASLSLAAPATNLQAREGFSVKAVPAGVFRKHGPSQMMKVYKKFAHVGARAPIDVVRAAQDDGGQQGSVEADPEQYDQAYICPVTVGANTLKLDFDTGSSDLWVFSTLTPSNEVGSHSVYDVSHGQKEDGETWNISYGDGSGASGVVYADQVVVGGVTATSQAVEAATSVSSEFVQDPSDGLLGLAFSSINTVTPNKATTFFDTVLSTLNQALFTADLTSNGPGEYTFGYIDSSKYSGSITYVPIDDSQGFWQFTAGAYSTGGSGNSSSGNIGTAIADTGTTLLLLPQSAVQAYYNGVSGASYDSSQGGYTFPCSSNTPDFQVSIGGTQFTVSGSDINYAPVSSGSSTCFGGIQSNSGVGFTIFGDVFLRNVYAIFDKTQSTPRLGLAVQQ